MNVCGWNSNCFQCRDWLQYSSRFSTLRAFCLFYIFRVTKGRACKSDVRIYRKKSFDFSWNDQHCRVELFSHQSSFISIAQLAIPLFHLGVGTRFSTFANRVSRAASLWVREKSRPDVIPACRRRRLKGNQHGGLDDIKNKIPCSRMLEQVNDTGKIDALIAFVLRRCGLSGV